MKIVIDIDDKYAKQFYKNKCKDKFDNLATNEFGYVLRKAFENATPLPEHHGRLIDADNIALIDEEFYVPSDYYVAKSAINDAPTIIEGSDSK